MLSGCAGKTSAKTIAFDFDLSMDTADSVAGEMVDEMDLSAGDFASIASAIRAEVHMLTGTSTPHLGSMMHHAAPQLLQRLSMPSESTAPTSAPASSADMHDICSPMSVAALSGGQPVSAEDLAFHGSSPDENWAEGADPSLALAAAEGDGSVPGGSPDHRASLSRLLSPRKRSSSTLPHMKRMMSQVSSPPSPPFEPLCHTSCTPFQLVLRMGCWASQAMQQQRLGHAREPVCLSKQGPAAGGLALTAVTGRAGVWAPGRGSRPGSPSPAALGSALGSVRANARPAQHRLLASPAGSLSQPRAPPAPDPSRLCQPVPPLRGGHPASSSPARPCGPPPAPHTCGGQGTAAQRLLSSFQVPAPLGNLLLQLAHHGPLRLARGGAPKQAGHGQSCHRLALGVQQGGC